MAKVWEVAPRKFDDLIDQLLANRGVDLAMKEDFFQPDFAKDLRDPFKLLNLAKAVERIKLAREKGEKIGIFADYDADGIPGAALLYKAFTAVGLKVAVYIPNREDGYGLSEFGIDYLIHEKCDLIVTDDLGIRSIEEAKYCAKKKIDLIITDHHLPGEEIPNAFCVINPKQIGDKYPFKELCGCGVAYKLVAGLTKYFPKEIDEKFLKWNLDLVCISTISDVVPLTGENRVLASYGLQVMRKTQNLGLQKLIAISGIKPSDIQAYHVGFQIGPRINAPGRMAHATKSFELLVTEDEKEAAELALWLNEKNESRQLAMDAVEEEASNYIDKNYLTKNKILIVAGDWNRGVIGPAASRLVEKYSRPVILFSKEKEIMSGSARSISGVNIVELFEKVASTIQKFGGHKGAAGIVVTTKHFAEFETAIYKIADDMISDKMLLPKIRIDADVDLTEMTKSLYEKVLRFEPFGMGNAKPVFMAENVRFDFPKFVGKEQNHFSTITLKDSHRLKSICFNFPYDKSMINKDEKYDIAFTLNIDNWNNESKLSLNIIDLKVHE